MPKSGKKRLLFGAYYQCDKRYDDYNVYIIGGAETITYDKVDWC